LTHVNSFQAHSRHINRIKQSPFNKNYVATCAEENTVKVWNVSSSFNWTLIRTYSQHTDGFGIRAMEWLDNDTLATGGWGDMSIQIWSLKSGQTEKTINVSSIYGFDMRLVAENLPPNSLKLLKNKIHLAAGLGPYGEIKIFDIHDGNLISYFKGHSGWINDFVQIGDDLLASSSWDSTVRIWNLTSNTCKFNLTGHTNWAVSLKLITSSILASGSQDATINLWDITSGQLIRTLEGHIGQIYWSVDLINSQTLMSGSEDGEIKLWNWSTGECVSTIQTGSFSVYSLAVISIN
jgi:WD40 repeat protein